MAKKEMTEIKWMIFYRGIVIIILLIIISRMPIMLFGEKVKGEFIGYSYRSTIRDSGGQVFPEIQFEYKGTRYVIEGPEDTRYKKGEAVAVVFYPSNPGKARIYTFLGLWMRSLIEIPVAIMIWYAFVASFPEPFISGLFLKDKRFNIEDMDDFKSKQKKLNS